MAEIRGELRGDENEPEIWVNLGDVVDWLDALPEQTSNPIAAETAQQIRRDADGVRPERQVQAPRRRRLRAAFD